MPGEDPNFVLADSLCLLISHGRDKSYISLCGCTDFMAAVLDNEKISHLCLKNTGYLLRTRPERSTVTFGSLCHYLWLMLPFGTHHILLSYLGMIPVTSFVSSCIFTKNSLHPISVKKLMANPWCPCVSSSGSIWLLCSCMSKEKKVKVCLKYAWQSCKHSILT